MRHLLFIIALIAAGTASAKPVITKTLCNYQTEPMAIVDSDGKIRVGWQYADDSVGHSLVFQSAYQLEVTERVTGKKVFDSGVVQSTESQFVELPRLEHNRYGYSWRVRIQAAEGAFSAGGTSTQGSSAFSAGGASPQGSSAFSAGGVSRRRNPGAWTAWSSPQTIRVMPTLGAPKWIGAITKADSRLPEGRWSNTVFKKDTFKTKWAGVDTLSMRSIVLRKTYQPKKTVADAMVYVCGLGHYEMCVNGQKVGDSEFAPLWSEYSKTVYYNVFDVTAHLGSTSVIGVLLGNGFFNVQRGGRYSKLQTSFGPPQLMFRMDITYSDGTTESVCSDSTWQWAPSPVTFNSIYGGESYDATIGRDLADASCWHPVVVTEGPAGQLRPETCQPVKIMEHHDVQSWKYIPADSLQSASAKTRRTVAKGAFVCDMGQNLSGFPEITVSGRAGQKVTLIVSERLTAQGACDQSQTGRPHYYEYTLNGKSGGEAEPAFSFLTSSSAPTETWHPRFSYYGFRYIQVEGAVMEGEPNPDGLPVLHRLQSCFVHSSVPEGSSFWCDNDLFTRTHRLIERAERSNMQAVLTDCPHREKLGWLEQDHLCGPSLLYNYDMTRLVPKVIRDIADTQEPNGCVPTTAPRYVSFGNLFDDSPEWGSTLIILPFQYYDYYGDSTLIADYYEPMRRYVDYLTSRADSNGIVSHGLGDWYDYGPWRAGFSRNTPVPLVATAHYIYDLQLISEAARMTGRQADERRYRDLCDQTVHAFNRHFFHPDSCYYGTGSQCSNALPLFLGICGDYKEAVLQNLIADIHAHGDRLTTGDVGNRYLFRVLADNGQGELLCKMLNHYETPGYGFQLKQGATTLTEQWDPRQGSSENHFMLGQIDEWLFRSLSGIRQQRGTRGMRHLVIDPRPVGDIDSISTTIPTLYGQVKVEYSKTAGTLQVQVPGGCDYVLGEP